MPANTPAYEQYIEGRIAGLMDRSEPGAAWGELPKSEQDEMMDWLTPTTLEYSEVPASGFGTMSVGCYDKHGVVSGKNSLGGTIYTYHLETRTCFDSARQVIDSQSVMTNRWGESSTPGWSFDGHLGSGKRTGSITHKQYTQGKFTLNVWVTVQTDEPCLQNVVTGVVNAAPTLQVKASCTF